MSASVFPARAGMSPCSGALAEPVTCVPRASGDEPILPSGKIAVLMCSPRERG